MMTDKDQPVVTDYLNRLRAEAGARLPADRARELVDDIRDHLREALPADATEADIRNAVDRLGSPAELVDEAGGAPRSLYAAPPAPAAGNRREMAALAMLVLSVVTSIAFPIAGLLLIAGLVLAFTSTRWSGADKAWATGVYTLLGMPLIVLGGVAALTTSSSEGCSQQMTADGRSAGPTVCSSSGVVLPPWLLVLVGVAVVAIHVYTAVRLYRHARIQDGS